MEDRKLNEQESLALIADMIRNTQNKMERHAGTPFLIWGYTTVIISIAVSALVTLTHNHYWQFLWLALPIISLPSTYLVNRNSTKEVKTYIDKIVSQIWLVFGIAGFMVSLSGVIVYRFPVLFCVILLMGMGTALTGLIIKFKPCIWGGFIAMALSYLNFLFTGTNSILIFAAVFIIMMVIPGHILNARAKKSNHGE
ncbi:MAG: hypothetical protein RR555_08100 [Bacteroidales bacterium]